MCYRTKGWIQLNYDFRIMLSFKIGLMGIKGF